MESGKWIWVKLTENDQWRVARRIDDGRIYPAMINYTVDCANLHHIGPTITPPETRVIIDASRFLDVESKGKTLRVVSLHGDLPRGGVNSALVTMLEEHLEQARRGELVSAAISGVLANGYTSSEWNHGNGWPQLSGAISRTHYRFMKAVEEEK